MKICKTIKELQEARKALKGSVGFVPTMGALHAGHLSLMNAAKKENDHLLVSIFVNPTQFLAGEDLDTYPKKEQSDQAICKRAGVDILFMPDSAMMYEADELSIKAPQIRGYILEGFHRPGHFDGVLQVVLKLFNLARPDRAYFGQKDAQQLFLIRHMVQRLFLDIEIVAMPTIREADGLALSSRNAYLSDDERKEALRISTALKKASALISGGESKVARIETAMYEVLEGLEVEYCRCVSYDFKALESIERNNTLLLIASKVGSTRLIDNLWL